MSNRILRARLEKIEAAFAQRGLTEEAPADVSETLAIIESVRPDMIRLSEIDRKRWYCPDDPRSILTEEEVEEETKIKLRVLEKCKQLGFPQGYGQRQYRKDGKRLNQILEKKTAADFIGLSSAEHSERTIIQVRRESLYELGPKYQADSRIDEIDGHEFDGFFRRTLFEWHEADHLEVLHPDEPLDDEEIDSLSHPERMLRAIGQNIEKITVGIDGPKERLDEWHARKGEDPRLFKTFADWMQYPQSASALRRQNQQLAELGFEPDTNTLFARQILHGNDLGEPDINGGAEAVED